MRSIRTIAILVTVATTVATTCEAQNQVQWLTDWRQARDLAQQQHRLVLFHFWSESCAPCLKLERNVFNRPEVARAFHSGYIPVKINVDQDKQLAAHYKVSSWPTDVIVDHNGRVVHKEVSPQDYNKYIALLDGVKANHAVAMGNPAPTPTTNHLANHGAGNHGAGDPRNSTFQPGGSSNQRTNNALRQVAPSQQAPVGNPVANPYGRPNQSPVGNSNFTPGGQQPGLTNQQQVNNPIHNPSVNQGGQAARTPGGVNQALVQGNATHPEQVSFVPGDTPRIPVQPVGRAQLPARAATMGLEAYCPVTLVHQQTWSKGDARWGAVHRGRTYLFASPQNQQAFLQNPDKYAPILSGYDPVQYVDQGTVADGRRKHGLYYGEKYFLFSTETSLEQFQRNPQRYLVSGY